MGWASGSEIMESFLAMSAFKNLGHKIKVAILFEFINILENHDCDTLHEFLGEDPAFDEAFFMLNPDYGDDDEDPSDEEE